MAKTRPPGSTGTIYQSRSAYYRDEPRGWSVINRTYHSYTESRPSYARGGVSVLPGGTRHRHPTAYNRTSVSVGEMTKLQWPGGSYSPGSPMTWVDTGVDGAAFIGTLPWKGVNVQQDAINECNTKCLTKLADQKVNLGENLATFRQTVEMFALKASLLQRALQSLKSRREFSSFLKLSARQLRRKGPLKALASEYLEYVYGLKPLMADVHDTLQILKQGLGKDHLIKSVGTARRNDQKSFPSPVLSYSTQPRTTSGTYKFKTTVWARVDPGNAGLRALNQLGLLNPLGLAWDLVSYSFVVDWFIPVGPVLYALSAPAGLIFVSGTISIRATEVAMITYKHGPVSTGVPVTYEGFNRSILSTWPFPGLWVLPDPFKKDRPLKAIALAIMRLP